MLKYLVTEASANVDLRDKTGRSALSWTAGFAGFGDYLPVVECLVETCGADNNLSDYENRSPLWYAVGRGHVDAVKYLLEKGAKYSPEDFDGKTPVEAARRNIPSW